MATKVAELREEQGANLNEWVAMLINEQNVDVNLASDTGRCRV
ncbi:MAG: hypothetical protein SAqMacA_38140 [Shewanella algae]